MIFKKYELDFSHDCFLFLSMFCVTGFIGFFILLLHDPELYFIGGLLIFFSLLAMFMVTTGINIKNHISLLLFLKTREEVR